MATTRSSGHIGKYLRADLSSTRVIEQVLECERLRRWVEGGGIERPWKRSVGIPVGGFAESMTSILEI